MAAVLWGGEGAVLSHLDAAVLWRVWRGAAGVVDVLTRRRRRNRPGLRAHECRNLDPRDVTRVRGIPVTTVARTLVDLGAVLDVHPLANVIHEAAYRDLFDRAETEAAMERARGHHGIGTLGRAIAAHESGSAGTRSALEDRFLALIRRHGLPEPLVNTKVEGIEVDLHFPDRRLCVEIDGPGHGRPRTRSHDRARDDALTRAGERILRFTPADLSDPERVLAQLGG
jgi:hypothetical protein